VFWCRDTVRHGAGDGGRRPGGRRPSDRYVQGRKQDKKVGGKTEKLSKNKTKS